MTMTNKPENSRIIRVYAAHGDGGERSIGPVIGYFTLRHDAEEYANGKGWCGGNGGVSEQWVIVTAEGVYALKQSYPIDLDMKKKKSDEELRKATLAKLSSEERRVLGLND